ncbi:MAG: hypothetical protein ACE5KU_06700, partial [Nitrososphaerales archaeon]
YCEEKYITEYDIPTPHSGPIGITVDPEGMIWFAETNATKIATFNPEDKTFKEYSMPVSSRLQKDGAQIWGMKFDGRGNLWFTEATEAAIWRFDTSKETFERYPLQPSTVFPIQLAFDSEGYLWFTELYGDRIGRLDPSKVVNNTREGISEYSIPTSDAGAAGILFDKDENLWFAESFSKKVAMLDTSTIRFKEYELPRPVYALVGLAFDNENRLWITDHGSSKFYRFDPQTSEFKEYSTSESPFFPVSLPYYIVSDSKGRVWMNEHYGNIIAVMDPESDVLTEYGIPTRDPRFGNISNVLHLTVDREDNIWFTEWTSNKIAVLDTHLPVPFSLETSERTINIDLGGNANITVKLNIDGLLDSPVHLYASGTFAPAGGLERLEASFEPSELVSERSVSTLTLKANRTLLPGVYTLMVGGKHHDVNRLVAVELVVGSPSISSPFFETWGLLLLALTPLLAVALYVFFRRFRRGSSG